MLIFHIRLCAYLVITSVFSSAFAGSYEDFFIALRNDHAHVVADLLRRGFEPNSRDPNGQPGLTVAMQEGSLKAARVLLGAKEIDVNALNASGESALMMAALQGDEAGVRLLLEHGAQVNQPGWSALHYAATGPQPRVVLLLLERGAEIDALSPNETTPLMMSAQYGSEESVKLLLAHGADPKRRNQLGLGVLDFAELSGRIPLVRFVEGLSR